MSRHIRVVLADDHPAVRAGLREVLETTSDIEVVGEAADGQAAVELAAALRPDLVVVDIHRPRLSGIATTRHLSAASPEVRVVGLSAAVDPPYTRAMQSAGALALLDKTVRGDVLVATIRRLVTGSDVSDGPITEYGTRHETA
jgi:DNA-binding NarL/FixJ family response regulator